MNFLTVGIFFYLSLYPLYFSFMFAFIFKYVSTTFLKVLAEPSLMLMQNRFSQGNEKYSYISKYQNSLRVNAIKRKYSKLKKFWDLLQSLCSF